MQCRSRRRARAARSLTSPRTRRAASLTSSGTDNKNEQSGQSRKTFPRQSRAPAGWRRRPPLRAVLAQRRHSSHRRRQLPSLAPDGLPGQAVREGPRPRLGGRRRRDQEPRRRAAAAARGAGLADDGGRPQRRRLLGAGRGLDGGLLRGPRRGDRRPPCRPGDPHRLADHHRGRILHRRDHRRLRCSTPRNPPRRGEPRRPANRVRRAARGARAAPRAGTRAVHRALLRQRAPQRRRHPPDGAGPRRPDLAGPARLDRRDRRLSQRDGRLHHAGHVRARARAGVGALRPGRCLARRLRALQAVGDRGRLSAGAPGAGARRRAVRGRRDSRTRP